jgi:hypothetical protein
MKTALWIFGLICGIVFASAYENATCEDNQRIVIIGAFIITFVVSLIDGVQSLPEKKNDEEIKRDA